MLPIERKSVEPLAAHTDPWHVSAKHQSLHHMVAKPDWSDEAVLTDLREWVSPALRLEKGCYWIVDDTDFPKKGQHSVGVARQYCGQLGKQDNCQVAVSLSLASARGSLPIALRLYLPEEWAGDKARQEKAGVPTEITFATKLQIALEQIRAAKTAGIPVSLMLGDAGYGNGIEFLRSIRKVSPTRRLYATRQPEECSVTSRTRSQRFATYLPARHLPAPRPLSLLRAGDHEAHFVTQYDSDLARQLT